MKFKDFLKKKNKKIYHIEIKYDDLICDQFFDNIIKDDIRYNKVIYHNHITDLLEYYLNYTFIRKKLSCKRYKIFECENYKSIVIFFSGSEEQLSKIQRVYGNDKHMWEYDEKYDLFIHKPNDYFDRLKISPYALEDGKKLLKKYYISIMTEKQILLQKWITLCKKRIPKEFEEIKNKYKNSINIDQIFNAKLSDEECLKYEELLGETLNPYLFLKLIGPNDSSKIKEND